MTRRLCVALRPWAGNRVGAVVMVRAELAEPLIARGILRALSPPPAVDAATGVPASGAGSDAPADAGGPTADVDAPTGATPARRRGRKPRAG